MEIIKGLIVKDILQLKSYKKTLLIFMIIFILTSISQETTKGMGNMIIAMMTLGFGMFSIATFSYDEMSKADRYILTLPVTKKEVVLAKYILVICSTIIGSILGIIISIIVSFVIGKTMPNILELIPIGLGSILGIGLVESIQMPCIYKLGAEKGRIYMFIVTAIVAFLIGGVIFIGEKLKINLPINNITSTLNQFLPLILIGLILIIYLISYKISYKIYNKKEV